MNNNDATAMERSGAKRQELELKKLEIEIRNLSRKWWKKSSTLIPLLIAVSTILTGWKTGWFSNEYKVLEIQRDNLEANKKELAQNIKEFREKELTSQIELRIDMLCKDIELCHPRNPSAKDIITMLQKDEKNRERYTKILVDRLDIADTLIEKIMIRYILFQGIPIKEQQSNDNEEWRLPASEWQNQFFNLLDENWDRPELDKIIQLGDWGLSTPYTLWKWTDLIKSDFDRTKDNKELIARLIRREYYKLIPDNIIFSEFSGGDIDKVRDVFATIGTHEAIIVFQALFGYVGNTSHLVERKDETSKRFARFLNNINRLDKSIAPFILGIIMHSARITKKHMKDIELNLQQPLDKLFSYLSKDLQSVIVDYKFPAFNPDSHQLDYKAFENLPDKAYLDWLISYIQNMESPSRKRFKDLNDKFRQATIQKR